MLFHALKIFGKFKSVHQNIIHRNSFSVFCNHCFFSSKKILIYDSKRDHSTSSLSEKANFDIFLEADKNINDFIRNLPSVGKHGKLSCVERLSQLLDSLDSFLEIGFLAGFQMDYGTIPYAGSRAGIGYIKGILCAVIINDSSVKGGTMFPISVKKQLRVQEIAMENRLPIVYVVDSGGAFLPLQAEIFPDKENGGRVFYNQSLMSARNIPQVALVCGSCTAGAAYLPIMSDEVIMVRRTGHIFLGGPPLVKAALGEVISADELGGSKMHCKVSGCADNVAEDESCGLKMCRESLVSLTSFGKHFGAKYDANLSVSEEVLENDFQESEKMSMRTILSCLLDAGSFREFKPLYGEGLIVAFASVHAMNIGIVAGHGFLGREEAEKAVQFLQICDRSSLPLLFINDFKNNNSNVDSEGTLIKAHGRLLSAIGTSSCPRICLVVGSTKNAVSYMMNSSALKPRFMFAWPHAQFATETCTTSLVECASHMLCDAIIRPSETRQTLFRCLQIFQWSQYSANNAETRNKAPFRF